MRKNIVVLSGLLALTTLIGCDNTPKSIKIVGSNIVYSGSEFRYYVTTNPSKATKDVTWTISDPSIADIDQTGKVSNVTGTGEFTITATSKKNANVKDSIKVTAYGGESKTQDEFLDLYETAHDKFADDISKAAGKKIYFTCEEGEYFHGEYVDGGHFATTASTPNVYDVVFEMGGEPTQSMNVFNETSLKSMFDQAETTYPGIVINYYSVNSDTYLYYSMYYEAEEEGQTKIYYNLEGYDSKGYLVSEITYSNFSVEKEEDAYLDYVHPQVAK